MELQIGDHLADETGEYEVIGRPYTDERRKDAHVRVKKVGQPEVTDIRSWARSEHELPEFAKGDTLTLTR